jgi:SRSO17 transposase
MMGKSIRGWRKELVRVHQRMGDLFPRSEVRERSLGYLEGLLGSCERKNSWQVAEWAGEAAPYGMQYLLDRARWDANAVQARLSEYVKEELGSTDAVLVLDETGFLKKGLHSAGVQRQYSGTAGRIENSQVGVFLCYAGKRGYVLLDRELYLPQSWVEDRPRCRAAGIPEEVPFQTKPMLGRQMLERAFAAGMPAGWVAGDEAYGHDGKLRRWLEGRHQPYVLAVGSDQRLWREDMRQHRVDEIAAELPRRAWQRLSAGHGAKGERLYDWALLPWAEQEGWKHTLLVRRSLEAKPEYAYYFTYAAKHNSTLKTLVSVAGRRWAVESAFQMAKSECGLDHYEVRHWQGWYRHITLSMLALAVLALLRAGEKKTFPAQNSSQRTGNPAFARFRAARGLAPPQTSSRLV